jgi:hypothetical protein
MRSESSFVGNKIRCSDKKLLQESQTKALIEAEESHFLVQVFGKKQLLANATNTNCRKYRQDISEDLRTEIPR